MTIRWLIVINVHVLEVAHHAFHALILKKVQVGNDQKKAQSERESLSKNRGGKKLN